MPNPKRVIFVIDNFVIGGVEKLLLGIISRLDKQKFAASIITVLGSGSLEAHFRELHIPIYFVGGKFPFNYKRLPYGIYWLVITPVILVKMIKLMWQFLLQRPAVVVTSIYQPDILGILAGCLMGVPKRVLIHHDNCSLSPGKAWLKRNIGLRLATHIVAVSSTVKDFLVTYFDVPPDRIEVIYNGIPTEQFISSDKSPDPSHLVLGMIGRLEPVKGPLVFVQALEILKAKFGLTPESYLGGDGSLKPNLLDYAAEADLSNLTLDGEIHDVPAWLKKIDILINPSLTEGFSLVILEGLAANKLVVVSDLPSTRESITDGLNGCLFPVGDAAALANILQRLLTDPVRFNQIKQKLREWRQQKLTLCDIQCTVEAYEKLLSA